MEIYCEAYIYAIEEYKAYLDMLYLCTHPRAQTHKHTDTHTVCMCMCVYVYVCVLKHNACSLQLNFTTSQIVQYWLEKIRVSINKYLNTNTNTIFRMSLNLPLHLHLSVMVFVHSTDCVFKKMICACRDNKCTFERTNQGSM